MFPTTGTRLSRRPPRYVGANLTANTVTVTNQVMVGNSTVNTAANSTHFFSGNSTVFGFSNSTAEGIANSTGNCITTPLSILFQSNTTSNSILSNSSLILNTNSTINCTMNSSSISYNGVSQRTLLSVLQTDFATTANANTVAVSLFPAGQNTVTLAASTTYLMDATLVIANATGAAAVTAKLAFGNSVAIGAIAYQTTSMVVNSSATAAFTTFGLSNAATIVTATTGATGVSNASIHLKGTLITSGAVGITPQLLYSAACANTPVVKTGSYIAFTPVQNSTVNTVGTWA